jgi:hypothetical protein
MYHLQMQLVWRLILINILHPNFELHLSLVSGEIFKLIMILGYSDVKSKSYIHLYNPGTGGITYAPANASAVFHLQ